MKFAHKITNVTGGNKLVTVSALIQRDSFVTTGTHESLPSSFLAWLND